MSGASFFEDMSTAMETAALINDPGDSGTIAVDGESTWQVCVCTPTGGGEDRILPDPTNFRYGTTVVVIDNGDHSSTFEILDGGNSNSSVALMTESSIAICVVGSSSGTKRWHAAAKKK